MPGPTLKARRRRYCLSIADALNRARELSQLITETIDADPDIARNLAVTEALDCVEAAIIHLDRVPKIRKPGD